MIMDVNASLLLVPTAFQQAENNSCSTCDDSDAAVYVEGTTHTIESSEHHTEEGLDKGLAKPDKEPLSSAPPSDLDLDLTDDTMTPPHPGLVRGLSDLGAIPVVEEGDEEEEEEEER